MILVALIFMNGESKFVLADVPETFRQVSVSWNGFSKAIMGKFGAPGTKGLNWLKSANLIGNPSPSPRLYTGTHLLSVNSTSFPCSHSHLKNFIERKDENEPYWMVHTQIHSVFFSRENYLNTSYLGSQTVMQNVPPSFKLSHVFGLIQGSKISFKENCGVNELSNKLIENPEIA